MILKNKILGVIVLMLFINGAVLSQNLHHRVLKLMGSRFEISIVEKDPQLASQLIDQAVDEITRIEKLISSWDENSQTSLINRNAGIAPVKVDVELFDLIKRSIAISKLSDGAFDISYASMDKIWKFDGSMIQMPHDSVVKKSVSLVGYSNIVLNEKEHTVFLRLKGMKIGFGAIGKGYAADRAKKLLQQKGVKSGIIDASGDLNIWGRQENGDKWTVAIKNPFDKTKSFAIFQITEQAVVTSGDYEKFVELNGVRYCHIINPKSGYPCSGIVSVSVFASSTELADALATSIFVMGKDVGIDRINQLANVECIVVGSDGKLYTSENIKLKSSL